MIGFCCGRKTHHFIKCVGALRFLARLWSIRTLTFLVQRFELVNISIDPLEFSIYNVFENRCSIVAKGVICMDENLIELLQIILNSDNPEQAIETAAKIISDYSQQLGSSDLQVSDDLPVSA